MKLFIRANQFKGGSLQVANSLLKELIQFPDNEYVVLISEQLKKQLANVVFPANFHFIDSPKRTKFLKTVLLEAKISDKIERKYKPDCVLTTSGPSYWRSKAPHVMGYNLPHHIYRDSPYFDDLSLLLKFRWFIKRTFHRYFFSTEAELLFVQTDDVNDRLKRFIHKNNVYTISNTFNQSFVEKAHFPLKLNPKTNGEIRLLTVCAFYPHKNLQIINQIIPLLKLKGYGHVKFVTTLQPQIFEEKFGHNEQIINVGPVSIAECPSLYDECDFMFLPTLLECFSASYAEAMIMEKPILTSDLGFARTVCHEAAVYFNPIDPADVTNKIIDLINDKAKQQWLIEEGKSQMLNFATSKERTAKILDLCEKAIQTKIKK